MKKHLLTVLLYFIITSLPAQLDKTKFEQVFGEEFEDSKYSKRKSHSGVYQYTKPQMVPDWFINPPVTEGNEVFAIGISNPQMDTTEALYLAITRARVMANVLRKSTTQLLCDFFQNEGNNTNNIVFEHFGRINSFLPANDKFEIVETYRNEFDETMVLIKYKAPRKVKPEELNKIRLELYRNEIETGSRGSFESIYEIQVKSNEIAMPDPMLYRLTELGPRFDVVNYIEGQKKEIPIYSLRYKGLPSQDSVEYTSFSHGLWNEYFRSVLLYIVTIAREKPENIQYMGETDVFETESMEKLTRGISTNRMRFVITGFSTTNNRLKVSMQELEVKR